MRLASASFVYNGRGHLPHYLLHMQHANFRSCTSNLGVPFSILPWPRTHPPIHVLARFTVVGVMIASRRGTPSRNSRSERPCAEALVHEPRYHEYRESDWPHCSSAAETNSVWVGGREQDVRVYKLAGWNSIYLGFSWVYR